MSTVLKLRNSRLDDSIGTADKQIKESLTLVKAMGNSLQMHEEFKGREVLE